MAGVAPEVNSDLQRASQVLPAIIPNEYDKLFTPSGQRSLRQLRDCDALTNEKSLTFLLVFYGPTLATPLHKLATKEATR